MFTISSIQEYAMRGVDALFEARRVEIDQKLFVMEHDLWSH